MSSIRRLFISVAGTLVLTAPLASGQDTAGVGSVTGIVFDAGHVPVPFATICVAETARCEVADGGGVFRLTDLRPGTIRFEVAGPGQPPTLTVPVEVRAGTEQRLEIQLAIDATLQEAVTVAGTVSMPEEIKTSGFLVSTSAILKDAGALQDVSRHLQALPGVVAGSDDFRNDLIVRGGSPLENLFVVDNVEVPNINTFANFASAGGTVSILDSDLLRDVTFLTGGYPAAYSNRTSSVLQITQREGDRERARGRATVGFAGAGAVVEGPLSRGNGSWVVSTRRSFLDLFTNDVGIGGVPVLYTVNGKVVYDLNPRDRVWAVTLTGVDRIRLGLTDDRPPDSEVFNFDIRYQGWRSATGVNWQRVFAGGVGLLGVTQSSARVRSTVKDLVRDGVPAAARPAADVVAASPVVFRDDSGEDETTIKYDLTMQTARAGKVQAGAVLRLGRARYDAAAPFGGDNPYAPSGSADPFAIDTRMGNRQEGAYVQSTMGVTSRLNVTLGGRVDLYHIVGRSRFSPRASGTYVLTERTTLRASTGLYHQLPPPLFLTAFSENRELVPFRAAHYVAGVAHQATASRRVSVEVYRKDYRDYPVAAAYPSLSLANLGDTFNVREILFPLASAGRGRAQGVELFAEEKGGERWFGQLAFTLSRARHAGLDGVLRPGSFDYPVTAKVTGGLRVARHWEIGLRVSALSGRPYTPFDEGSSRVQRRGVYDLTRVNAVRAPTYFRADLRVDRLFTIAGQPVILFAGVQNITGRQNFSRQTWNRRTNAIDRSDDLGLFPVLGLDWRLF